MLEGAKQKGKATGIIATSEIQHATPAGYSGHHKDRNNFEVLGEQQVYQNMDVVLGGGKESLQPGTKDKSRKDGEDLVKVLKDKSTISLKRKINSSSQNRKIWGAFSQRDLAYDMDRRATHPEQPTIAEMTKNRFRRFLKTRTVSFYSWKEASLTGQRIKTIRSA